MRYHVEVESENERFIDVTITPEGPVTPEQVEADVREALEDSDGGTLYAINWAPDEDGIGYDENSFTVLIEKAA